ncbi:sugar diacid recognition domain-containing protein, partial [Escherichia coli]
MNKIHANYYLQDSTARQIVQRTMGIIPYSVNVMNEHGMIIASGEASRLHQRHEGAVLALTENRVVEIDSATANKLKGVKPGINLPINFRDQLIGVLGITGEPGEVKAYAQLVKMASELIIEQMALLEQKQWDKRYREELINQLILRDPPPDSLNAVVSWLGINLQLPRVVVIMELQQPDRDALHNLMEYFEYRARDHLVTFSDFNDLIILKPISLKNGVWDKSLELSDLQRLKHYAQSCGFSRLIVGGYFSGENGLHRSFQTAKSTQSMAKRLKLKHQFIFHDDYALASLLDGLSGTWQAEELSKIWRNLVAKDTKGMLQKTLQNYFDHNCD